MERPTIASRPYIPYIHFMNAASAKTFKSGNSEAIRLPKGLGFGIGTEVRIERDGDRVVLTPVHSDAERAEQMRQFLQMIEEMKAIRGDVILPREERDTDWWPDRPGL
ncbi:MAG: antitoxin [Thermaurantiacus sp.]